MYRIGKMFSPVSAAHRLPDLGPDHKCSRLHGHNYAVEVVIASEELQEPGLVVDFADLALVGEYLHTALDHRYLNDVLPVAPTSENFARHVFDWCDGHLALPDGVVIEAVRVSETPSTWAEYRPTPAPRSVVWRQEAGSGADT